MSINKKADNHSDGRLFLYFTAEIILPYFWNFSVGEFNFRIFTLKNFVLRK